MANIFYVYEHWRPDTGVCFYVGKGKGQRAWCLSQRGKHHNNTIRALQTKGLLIEVKILAQGLTEKEAFELEKTRISFWKSVGAVLCNKTDGGEGISGYSHKLEAREAIRKAAVLRLSDPKIRAKIAEAHTGLSYGPLSSEHRAKIGAAHRGRKDTDEAREKKRLAALERGGPDADAKAKIADSVKNLWADPAYHEKMREAHRGRKAPPEVIAKMKAAQAARREREGKVAPETLAKMSLAQRARHASKKYGGWKFSDEAKARMSAAQKIAQAERRRREREQTQPPAEG